MVTLSAEQLAARLTDKLSPLWLVHGNEPLLVIEATDAIRSTARAQGYAEREVLIAGPGFNWDALFIASGNLSLFGGDKLIDLRIPTGKPGRDGGDALTRYARNLPAGTVTLIQLPEMDWAARKAAWFVALCEAATVVECNAPPHSRLPGWITERLRRQQQKVSPDTAAFIADRVEGNLLAAQQEIMKLALLYPPGELSLEQVRAAVLDVARYDLEDLQQALLAGDLARCARVLDGLRGEGAAPPLVLWTLASVARTLSVLTQAREDGVSVDTALKAQRIFGSRQAAYQVATSRLDSRTTRQALIQAARIDRIAKGVACGDLWDECLQLCLCLIPKRTSRHA